MALDRSPWFYFYAKDWRSSPTVHGMSFTVRGMYFEMLIEQWLEGSAPASPEACAARFGGGSLAWKNAWKKLEKCFVRRKKDGRLVNAKMKQVRQQREDFLKRQRQHGLRGAQHRWNTDSKPIGSLKARHSNPNGVGMAKHSHRSDLISSDLISSDLKEKNVRTHTRARAAREEGRESFDAFWNAYPKKQSQADAWRVWQKLKPTAALLAEMVSALDWQRHEADWIKDRGQFIPRPAKWLRGECWKNRPSQTPHVNERTIATARSGEEFLRS